MSNLIKIKRGTGTSLLESGELGFNTDTKTLYVGDDNINLAIGGEGSFVKKSGDTMTGILTTKGFTIHNADTDYPSLTFQAKDATNRSILIQPNLSDGVRQFAIYQYPSDSDDAETRYYEAYKLPTTPDGLVANGLYNILTTKNTVTIAQGGTGATTADSACENIGAVKKSGDVMTGTLHVPYLRIHHSSDDWSGTDLFDEDGNYRAGFSCDQNNRVFFRQKKADLEDSEHFCFPIPTTSGVWYDVLTSKELSKWQSTFMNSFAVNHTIDVQTTDVLSLPPGIYHHEAATSTDNNYPISETRALVEVKGQYRAGTAATDGYPNGYWSVCVTYPFSGKKYWNHRTWSTWTGWRDLTAGSTGNITAESIGAVKKSGDTMTGMLTTTKLTISTDYPTINFNIISRNDVSAFTQINSDGSIRFYSYNLDQDGKSTRYWEGYYLPSPSSGLTKKTGYNILTTKSAVTVAQGGTGGTNPDDACYNLGAFRNTTTSDAYYMNGGSGTASAWVSYLKNGSTLNQMDLWSSYTSFKQPVNIASGGTGATSAAGARTNLGITCANLGALPLSGGTMTGTITLHTTGLKTSSTSGFSTNQHGNFVHQTNTESHNWSICNSANTAKFQVWYETGAVTAQGKVTAPCFGGNGIRYSSSQPTSNLQTGQIWLKPV